MKKHSLIFLIFLGSVILISACHKKHYEKGIAYVKPGIDTVEYFSLSNTTNSYGKSYGDSYYKNDTVPIDWYANAFKELNILLKCPATNGNFKRAVFTVENAWYENQLNYESYDNYLQQLATVCRLWVESNKLDYHEKDSIQINLSAAVYTLITDTINSKKGFTVTMPYGYDFEDYFGAKDWEKMFVCKLLQTQNGNCHSLPYLYKILAEEVGVPAYLSIVPNHIFIKQYNKKTGWYNTELTNGRFPTDAWVMAAGYVSTESIVSGIYMDTLSYQQSVALCVNDLAKGYVKKFEKNADLNFVLKCCDLGLEYYPNYAELLLLKAETLRSLYERGKDNQLYSQMEFTYIELSRLHYREISDKMYGEWMGTLNRDTSIYFRTEIKTSIDTLPALTLSDGRYDEFFENDTLQRIGSVMFNTVTEKVKSFLNREDSLVFRPAETGRWMSVDPVFQPWQSPYTSMDNDPINLNDPMGDVGGKPDKVSIKGQDYDRHQLDGDPPGGTEMNDKIDLGDGKTGEGKYIDKNDKSKGFYAASGTGKDRKYYKLTPVQIKTKAVKAENKEEGWLDWFRAGYEAEGKTYQMTGDAMAREGGYAAMVSLYTSIATTGNFRSGNQWEKSVTDQQATAYHLFYEWVNGTNVNERHFNGSSIMGQQFLKTPEVQNGIKNAIDDAIKNGTNVSTKRFERVLQNEGKIDYVSSLKTDAGPFGDNPTRGIHGSFGGNASVVVLQVTSDGMIVVQVQVTCQDALSAESGFHTPPIDGEYGESLSVNNPNGPHGDWNTINVTYDIKTIYLYNPATKTLQPWLK
jgi:hypothetical protein